MNYNDFCLSSFLTFRYVVLDGEAWKPGIKPKLPLIEKKKLIAIENSDNLFNTLKDIVVNDKETGILLSGGIDSAILASFLSPRTKAYTIKFVSENAIDETVIAERNAKALHLEHKIVEVTWDDYKSSMNKLMKYKKSPLHAIEVPLYKAAKIASEDGIKKLIVGNGADSTFGGMDKLLSKDWNFSEFVDRYTFVNPNSVLKKPISMINIYEKYRKGKGIDILKFLKNLHGLGIIQTFENALNLGGCQVIAPYESLYLSAPLDMKRIRTGESKYILRELFKKLFSDFEIPEKIPFARPMDDWFSNWEGPSRSEFLDNLNISQFSGEQKWLIYCLENFLNLFE